ncbi:MAG: PA14 domain-containing protein [Verrucomicrobiales bacterium]
MRICTVLSLLLAQATLTVTFAQDATENPGARTWSHSDGRKVKAGISSATADSVVLRLPNGVLGKVELAQLSRKDRDHVAAWLKNNAAPKGFGNPDRVIEITTLKGQMKYNKPTFSVYPGKKIKLVLLNGDDMHHNLVITKPGKGNDFKVAQEAWKLGADGFAESWIPQHPDLLFASNMANPQSTATLYFTAPKKTGKYPYVCTLPGHAQVMRGTMLVTREINPLSELTFTLFKGSWKNLPDWNKLKSSGTDHVPSGKFDLSCTKERDSFGLVFNGKIEVTEAGIHTFTIASDDGSRLFINRKVVVKHDGIHAMSAKSGKVKLEAGSHDIELQYFEGSGQEELYVGWKPPGTKKELALSKKGRPSGGGSPSGQLLVAEDEARIYRNFIQGAGPRAIGVGYPGGLNLAYDANNMRIAMVWLEDFIDAKRHWNGRGQGYQPPAGQSLVNNTPGVPFAVINDANAEWPQTFLRKDNQQLPPVEGGYFFKGYSLGGEARIPTFRYTFGGLAIEDSPVPEGSSESADAKFVRTLKITGKPVNNLYFRAAVANAIDPGKNGAFAIGDSLIVTFKSIGKPIIRDSGGRKELLVPAKFNGNTVTIEQTISWQ